MRIRPISDTHIEFDPSWKLPDIGEFDVNAVLGDAANPMMPGLEWVARCVVRPDTETLYVPGNHDYYPGLPGSGEEHAFFEEQNERGREFCEQNGIRFMLNDAVVIGAVRFVGFTGWSDWPASLAPPNWTRTDLFSQSSKGWIDDGPRDRNYHNDYREIKVGGPGSRNRLRPSQTLAWHRESMAFLRETLATPFDEGTDNVILTHMGPASSVSDPGGMHSWLYGAQDLEDFLNDLALDPTAPSVPLLLHGHVHRSLDYHVGRTRVVCNPKGYLNENPHFDPAMIVEVGEDYSPTMGM